MTHAILAELNAKGIDVATVGDQLELTGPKRAITPEVIAEVRQHKQEILDMLAPVSPEGEATANEIEALMALGLRLRRGEIKALQCGITGEKCIACPGHRTGVA